MVTFLNCYFLFFILFFLSISSIPFSFFLLFFLHHTRIPILAPFFFLFYMIPDLSLSLSLLFLFLLDSRTFSSSLCDKKQRKNKQEISCLPHRWSKDTGKRLILLAPLLLALCLFLFFSFLFLFFAFIVMIWLILRLCFWVCILILLEFRDV